MLSEVKIEEARRLLVEGKLSQRKIAQEIGISRSTLAGIASGRRPDYEALRQARGLAEQPLGPVERCRTCGGLVHMPCQLCKVRALKEGERELLRRRRRVAQQLALRRLLCAVRQHCLARDAEEARQQNRGVG